MTHRMLVALSGAAVLALVFALRSGAGVGECSDPDFDGICNDFSGDNCAVVPNPGQRDDDEDGYGNPCDDDVTQDCIVGIPDVAAVFNASPGGAPWVPKRRGAFDVNEDGLIGIPDVAIVFAASPGVPGPTTRLCADCLAAPGTGVCP